MVVLLCGTHLSFSCWNGYGDLCSLIFGCWRDRPRIARQNVPVRVIASDMAGAPIVPDRVYFIDAKIREKKSKFRFDRWGPKIILPAEIN
jgi:hypothetical protein